MHVQLPVAWVNNVFLFVLNVTHKFRLNFPHQRSLFVKDWWKILNWTSQRFYL